MLLDEYKKIFANRRAPRESLEEKIFEEDARTLSHLIFFRDLGRHEIIGARGMLRLILKGEATLSEETLCTALYMYRLMVIEYVNRRVAVEKRQEKMRAEIEDVKKGLSEAV